MKILKAIAILVTAAGLPLTAAALSDAERDVYVNYIMGKNENPLKDCATAALQLNTGLTAKRMTRASDESIAKDLLADVIDAEFKAEREKEIAAWKQSKNPGQVAFMHFSYCLKVKNVKAELGSLGRACFNLAGVPALAEVLKRTGVSQEQAIGRSVALYRQQLSESFVRDAFGDVYSHNADKDAYESHRRVLAQCIKTMELAPVSDDALRKEYERFKLAIGDKEYHAAHILVWTKEAAEQVMARLNAGESFEALARTTSFDASTAGKGGDLGWNAPTSFEPAFAAAVKQAKIGSIASEPVHTSFGWHVIKVIDSRPLHAPSFEDVKEKLRASVQARQMK